MQNLDEIRTSTVYEPRPIGRVSRTLLFLTALIPVLAIFGGTTVLLIYTIFVVILLFLRRPLSRAAVAIPSAAPGQVHRADDPLRLDRRTGRVVRELWEARSKSGPAPSAAHP